jgi:ubiquinone/menaquinone biosynthesis C-methylase UbiE
LNEEPRKTIIRDRYEKLGAGLYDLRYGDEQKAKYREALSLVEVEEWQTVLDDGCGTGLFLAELNAYAVGLDLSPGLLREARKRTSLKWNVHLVNGDSENLPLRSGAMDATFSFTVLQNLPDPVKMLAESRRASSKGARHIVTVHRRTMTLGKLRALIEKSSLKLIKIVDSENTKDWIVLAK